MDLLNVKLVAVFVVISGISSCLLLTDVVSDEILDVLVLILDVLVLILDVLFVIAVSTSLIVPNAKLPAIVASPVIFKVVPLNVDDAVTSVAVIPTNDKLFNVRSADAKPFRFLDI